MEININVDPDPGVIGSIKTVTVERKNDIKERQTTFVSWYIELQSNYGNGNPELLDKLETAKDFIK